MTLSPPEQFILLGHPVAHSLSPAMHNAAFAALEMHRNYALADVLTDEFPQAMERLRRGEWAGANVTIPHKQRAHQHVDSHDLHATQSGSVNTIIASDGALVGHDTDGPGLIHALQVGQDFDARGARCVVLGAGGAANAVVSALATAGARTLTVLARRPEEARKQPGILRAGADVGILGAMDSWPSEVDLVVHATPVGLGLSEESDRFASTVAICARWLPRNLPPTTLFVDLIYTPRNTAFLTAAARHGMRLEDGLGMLVAQAQLAFQLWTGHSAPEGVMQEAAINLLRAGR